MSENEPQDRGMLSTAMSTDAIFCDNAEKYQIWEQPVRRSLRNEARELKSSAVSTLMLQISTYRHKMSCDQLACMDSLARVNCHAYAYGSFEL